MELVIEGNVYYGGRVQKLSLGIEEGTIVAVKKVIRGDRTRDFGDRLIVPGAIDCHVHLREPGMVQKEDLTTGTTAAALGGVTTVLDMPNTKPPTVWAGDLTEKLYLVRKKSCVDVGLYCGITGKGSPERLAPFIVGYKLYMGSTTGDLLMDDYAGLPRYLCPLEKTGLPLAVHAEDEHIIRKLALNARDAPGYNDARPPECERSAVEAFLRASGENRGHICHISTGGALEAVRAARERRGPDAQPVGAPSAEGENTSSRDGISPAAESELKKKARMLFSDGGFKRAARASGERQDMPQETTIRKITCEVSPHHLLLDVSDGKRLKAFGKMNPPLRSAREHDALWNALQDGTIDVVASDHAPHLEDEKDVNFDDAPAGVPGVQTMVPLLMHLVKHGKLDLGRLQGLVCTNPSAIFDLGRGALSVGMPAHLAVYDLHTVDIIRGKKMASKCQWSPFEGREAVFPRAVFLRGVQIVEDGEAVVSPGSGRTVSGKTPSKP